jgi:hypothetical protein
MKILIYSDDDILLWVRQVKGDQVSGITSADYLRDGTQQKIIGALEDALSEANGQLCCSLDVADVISNIGATSAKINSRVPIAIVWDRDARRKPLVETAVVVVTPTDSKAAEV